ncbi:MAG: PCP reductase family protein [Nitrospinae bacterium]|nr:PCP reductase family protein [Nitrospinota bacterium]
MESLLKSREKANELIIEKFQKYFQELPPGAEGKLVWTKSAEERLQKAPPFVRDMARQAIEDFAEGKGAREITPELIEEAMETIVPKGSRPAKGD